MLYGGLSYLFSSSNRRLRIRDTATKLIEVNGLQLFVDIAQRYTKSPFFWLLAIFAFNPRNIRRRSAWPAVLILFTVVVAIAESIWVTIASENLLLVGFAIAFILILPSVIGIAMEFSIDSETNSDVARFRCWFLLQAKRTGRVPTNLKDISSHLVHLLRPYTEEEYKEKSAMWQKRAQFGMYSFLTMMAVFVALIAIGSPFMSNTLFISLLLVLTFGGLGPALVAQWFESTKKPVLYDDPSLVIPDVYGVVGEPTIQEVADNYQSQRVWRGMKLRSWLIYHFGPLFAWDIEGFRMVGVSMLVLGIYILARNAVPPQNLPALNIATLFIPLLVVMAVWSAWRGGGGVAKAKERRLAYGEILRAESIAQVISSDKLLQSFQLGDYATPGKKATRDQLIAELYIRSIPNWLRPKNII